MNNIYFRVDMNSQIATGHMMRCLSIADEVREQGGEAIFITADENACELLTERGFDYIVLNTKWDKMEEELPKLENIINEKKIKKLIIDSYYATGKYLNVVDNWTKILYIDDLNRKDLQVNTILSYPVYADENFYKKYYLEDKVKLLIGADYTPLRRVFKDVPDKKIRKNIERVLILSGGSDPYDTIKQCINVLIENNIREIYAIYGRYSDRVDTIKNTYKNEQRVHVYESVDNIEKYMQEADLCISASGTTLYELCACGTPTLSYILADNQIDNALGFDKKGIIPCLGDVRKENIANRISEELEKMKSEVNRKDLSEKMKSVVDGQGCRRIVGEFG